MFWWIFMGVSLVLSIIFIFIVLKNDSFINTIILGVNITAFICMLIILPVCQWQFNQKMDVFIRQKQYIEEVVPTLPERERYGFAQKKVELNEWLYNAQYSKKHFTIFSMYSDKVLELTEIK